MKRKVQFIDMIALLECDVFIALKFHYHCLFICGDYFLLCRNRVALVFLTNHSQCQNCKNRDLNKMYFQCIMAIRKFFALVIDWLRYDRTKY